MHINQGYEIKWDWKKKRQNKERDIRVKSGGGFITFI